VNRYYRSVCGTIFYAFPKPEWRRTTSSEWSTLYADETYVLEQSRKIPSLLLTLKGEIDAWPGTI